MQLKKSLKFTKANSVDEWDYQDDSYPSLASDPCWFQVSLPSLLLQFMGTNNAQISFLLYHKPLRHGLCVWRKNWTVQYCFYHFKGWFRVEIKEMVSYGDSKNVDDKFILHGMQFFETNLQKM